MFILIYRCFSLIMFVFQSPTNSRLGYTSALAFRSDQEISYSWLLQHTKQKIQYFSFWVMWNRWMIEKITVPCFDIFTALNTTHVIVFILFFGMTHHACLIFKHVTTLGAKYVEESLKAKAWSWRSFPAEKSYICERSPVVRPAKYFWWIFVLKQLSSCLPRKIILVNINKWERP